MNQKTRRSLLGTVISGAALVITACTGASIVNSEIKRERVSPMKIVLIVTNLNLSIDADLFAAVSSQFQRELQRRGVSASMLVSPSPESLADKPDVRGTVARIHATHVLALFDGRGEQMVDRFGQTHPAVELDVIASVSDTRIDQKVWASRFDYTFGAAPVAADVRAKDLVDILMGELKKAGLLP